MKWSIIRVRIITLFMGLMTIVLGMTDDDRQGQRRAERHRRKLQQYKSGWNRTDRSTRTCNMPVPWDCFPLALVGITGKKNSGKRRSCSACSSFFFQQGKSNFHVEKKLRAVGGSSRRQVVVGTTGDGAVHEHWCYPMISG